MVRSSGFGSITSDICPIQARFHYGFSILCFNLPLLISRRLPLPGFFSPFPHGTVSLSVIQEYLALRGGPRRFTRNFTCSMLLGIQFDYFNFRLQDYHFLWLSIPTYSSNCPNRLTIVPLPLVDTKFRLLPFRSPLLRESFFTFFSSRY